MPAGWDALFDNLKVAYDTNAADAITSADDLVIEIRLASISSSRVLILIPRRASCSERFSKITRDAFALRSLE